LDIITFTYTSVGFETDAACKGTCPGGATITWHAAFAFLEGELEAIRINEEVWAI
jgi:hypothetical protein